MVNGYTATAALRPPLLLAAPPPRGAPPVGLGKGRATGAVAASPRSGPGRAGLNAAAPALPRARAPFTPFGTAASAKR